MKLLTSGKRRFGTGMEHWSELKAAFAEHGIGITDGNPHRKAISGDEAVLADAGAVNGLAAGCVVIALAEIAVPDTGAKTWWVARNDWVARKWREANGRGVDRIIYGGVDVDRYFPAERQHRRDVKRPVVLCQSGKKQEPLLEALNAELAGSFFPKSLGADRSPSPDELRAGDVWVALTEGAASARSVLLAMATDLVVVTPDAGFGYCWGPRTPLAKGVAATSAGIAVSLDGATPASLASAVRTAWGARSRLRPRMFARAWLSRECFARKWLESIAAATKRGA